MSVVSTGRSLSSVLVTPKILGRLAAAKLKEEASSQEPSLRRWLGHHGVFQKCNKAAEECTTHPVAPRAGVHAIFCGTQTERPSMRTQITGALKALGRCNQNPAQVQDTNDLSRVQAKCAKESTRTNSRNHLSASRAFQGLNPFAKFKQRVEDKAVGWL
ncbi:uncharacterized protein BJX67DRAFT_45612 [Aspergillus lucknowensis]|uniref:Uncharacterized protein n=1 Tax=Aspergillus lucknowensis TaxID=176173 RepID=A0ABR4LVM9_9EURO